MKKRKGRSASLDIAGKRRAILKNLRFSEAEWKFVQEKMDEAKIAEFSEYARLACLQVSPVILDSQSLNLLAEIQKDLVDFKKMMQLLESFASRLKC